jgi:hypothetical protein
MAAARRRGGGHLQITTEQRELRAYTLPSQFSYRDLPDSPRPRQQTLSVSPCRIKNNDPIPHKRLEGGKTYRPTMPEPA